MRIVKLMRDDECIPKHSGKFALSHVLLFPLYSPLRRKNQSMAPIFNVILAYVNCLLTFVCIVMSVGKIY